MRIRITLLLILLAAAAVPVAVTMGGDPPAEPEYTTNFGLQFADLVPNGRNLYFSLIPGTRLLLAGDDEGEFVEVEIMVTDKVQVFPITYNGVPMMVTTRVVREREWVDGELVEVSRNFYARDRNTNNIYYFGERVDIYEDGEIVSHDGAWIAGVNGAQPGLIMPSVFLAGARYFQEIAADVAMDRGKNVTSGFEFGTPAGNFQNCIRISESSPLEPGSSSVKVYAPGIGMVFDNGISLVEYELPSN